MSVDPITLGERRLARQVLTDDWHTCKTTHCRAGWAIILAGEEGQKLEDRVGPAVAGALIYAASGSHLVPDFTATNKDALADMRARASK